MGKLNNVLIYINSTNMFNHLSGFILYSRFSDFAMNKKNTTTTRVCVVYFSFGGDRQQNKIKQYMSI